MHSAFAPTLPLSCTLSCASASTCPCPCDTHSKPSSSSSSKSSSPSSSAFTYTRPPLPLRHRHGPALSFPSPAASVTINMTCSGAVPKHTSKSNSNADADASANPNPTPTPTPPSSFDPESLVRPSLLHMAPYSPILPYDVLADRLGRAPSELVKLDANENPYGPAPSVATALQSAEYLHVYPDPESTALRHAIASYVSIPPEYILAGAGADELIDLLFRLFITPGAGHTVVNCPPTFGMYRFDADVNGAQVIDVFRDAADFSVDIDAVENVFEQCRVEGRSFPKMVFVTSPNNPDGSVIDDEVLNRLLKLPSVIVLDEAYFEFGAYDRIKLVPDRHNLIVLRTFSKWAALAGMRVGYGAFPLNVLKHLWKIKQPYNVSVAAQIAAVASIKEKHDLLNKVSKLVMQRKRFYGELKKRKNLSWLVPFENSQANYVLCRVTQGRAAVDVKEQLAKRGVLVRYYTSTGLSDCIRISMGTEQQMDAVFKALGEL